MKLPHIVIAGAPKSGSSSLFWWLSSHPEVCASKVKETHFFDDYIFPRFNDQCNVHEHGLEKYSAYFSHCSAGAQILEATPIYIYQQTALKELANMETKPKIIFVLREPSQRAFSQFRFNKYRLGNIALNETYVTYLDRQKGKEGDPLARGHYIKYLSQWKSLLGEDRIYVVQSEALFSNKKNEMKKLADFLGIQPSFYDEFDFMKRNETVKMRSTKLHKFGLRMQRYVPQWLQEKVIIPIYLKINATAMPPVSASEKALVEKLKAEFAKSNSELSAAFPTLDLSLWK